MHLLDLTLPSIAENLALDEALLLHAEEQAAGEILRYWEQPELAVVLGISGVAAEDVDEEACKAASVPLARRASGGGTVLLGPGCLCFSLVLDMERRPQLRAVGSSYRFILSTLSSALASVSKSNLGAAAEFSQAGLSDLVFGDAAKGDGHALRKFSGNSQKRGRRFLLHHGTLLLNFDLPQISRFLKEPPRQPDYRLGRSHDQFIANLNLSADDVKAALAREFAPNHDLTDVPWELSQRLLLEKYARSDWVLRR